MKPRNDTIAYILVIAMLVLSGTVSLKLYFRERTSHDVVDMTGFPKEIDGWKGADLTITEKEYEILETRNLVSRNYVNENGQIIYLFIVYSETNRSVFHPPEVCMMGGGLSLTDKKVESVDSARGKFTTNVLYAEKDAYKEIMLYSYKAGKIYTDNFYVQQAYLVGQQIFGRYAPGATVRVGMPIGDSGPAETLEALRGFLGKVVDVVDRMSNEASV